TPRLGYYARAVGLGRDFRTSPEIHPAFGALLAQVALDGWRRLGQPARFLIVEIGGGLGGLAKSLLEALRVESPEAFAATRYHMVECSAALRRRQRERLAGLPVTWGPLPVGVEGVVLSNELFDALPTHCVAMRAGQLVERYVALDGDRFVWREGPPSAPALRRYLAAIGVTLPDDYETEIALAAPRLIRRIGAAMRRGWVVTIDYGYLADERYAPTRRAGTLQCYYRGAIHHDPLQRVGHQDITTHVDFTALLRFGERAGLTPIGLTTQRDLLRRVGFLAVWRSLVALPPPVAAVNRRALTQLVDPDGLGRFVVVAQRAGDAPAELIGLSDDRMGPPTPRWAPLLDGDLILERPS
ncbi:MAG: SAM-dependent methyltransferase, partial [Dehalococcoidia bacterium]|nr:SAM-dependent methyltransferase [Dehalococcoidia bacterium]